MSCIICGECLENGYSIKLECSCDYQYHYECISTTLKHDKYNRCPYCATPYQLLPIVNGIKKIDNKKSYNVIYKNKKGNLQNKRIINGKVIYKRQT